ncbi:MAG TPA: spermidine synthase [Thermoanaerobaculia bacterium]|nr:spermidine synthase [Thermoanaerobaculia bacterium]
MRSQGWQTVDGVETAEGRLELRRRGESDWVITVGGRVLMSSAAHRSETALAELACRSLARESGLAGQFRPRVLLGGLGMGYTLRAALDALPGAARVVAAEIEPAIVRWCRGPLAHLTAGAAADPRVRIVLADVADVIAAAARPGARRFDAILLDLFEGPRAATAATRRRGEPFYSPAAIARTRAALAPGGLLAVWSEDPDAAFEHHLAAAGFTLDRHRPGRGGPRHIVYLAAVGRAGDSGGRSRRPRTGRQEKG